MKKIDRSLLPYVETEGTVICSFCKNSYEIEKRQQLNSIFISVCPHCGRQNINVITNSLNFIDEVLQKIEIMKKNLEELKISLEIEMQEKPCVDNYPDLFSKENNYHKLI
ncbi:hypothetical protein [Marinitoga litoralis]|uniref:hypothetical protein n=1 Tax=Marinitoga litoralis TaxID=570855 RepID=UPI00196057A5|nr:hypothetical protein [Marinitoga litoralis]MBM7559247.1 uncharacterized Zn finger protein (UPF0148 family) [Marinitoga litoralis]